MIIRLTRMEHRVLTAMSKFAADMWVNARDIAAEVFSSDMPSGAWSVSQRQVRTVRNSLRKIVREQMAQMHTTNRGRYIITERGKSAVKNTGRSIESLYSHGQAIREGRKITQSVYESRNGKPVEVKAAPQPNPVASKNSKKPKITNFDVVDKKPKLADSVPKTKKLQAPKRSRSAKKSSSSQVVLESQGSNGVSHQPIVSADGLGNAVL